MNTQRADSKNRYVGPRDTYRAAGNVVAANNAAPFISINGAAGKIMRIKRIIVSCFSLTAVSYLRIAVVKRSAATTLGTPVAATVVPLDSASPPAVGTVNSYTTAPTPGAAVGPIAERRILGQAAATASGYPEAVEFKFGDMEDNEAPALKSAAEALTVDFAAAPGSATTLSFEIEWTEDGN